LNPFERKYISRISKWRRNFCRWKELFEDNRQFIFKNTNYLFVIIADLDYHPGVANYFGYDAKSSPVLRDPLLTRGGLHFENKNEIFIGAHQS